MENDDKFYFYHRCAGEVVVRFSILPDKETNPDADETAEFVISDETFTSMLLALAQYQS